MKLLIALILLGFSGGVFSYGLYEAEIPAEITLTIKNFKKHLHNIGKAHADKSSYIRDIYKKKIKASVRFLKNGNHYWGQAKVRITGDGKDHLGANRQTASLKVKMINGNIGGIVSFRLLLPHTKGASNEILWSILMEQLGFPVPLRRFISVNLNGIKYQVIFEESPEKEFIERFAFREVPIVERDERQLWENLSWRSHKKHCIHKKNDGTCGGADYPNKATYKIDNSSFIKNNTAIKIALKAINININNINQATPIFKKVNAKYAKHGLNDNNRKYIYDPLYGVHIPIYFDGGVNKISKCNIEAINVQWSSQASNIIKIKLNKVQWKFNHRSNKTLTSTQECVAKEVLLNAYASGAIPTNKSVININDDIAYLAYDDYLPLKYIKEAKSDIVGIDLKDNKIKKCNNQATLNCKTLTFKKIKKYLSGDSKAYKYGVYKVFPIMVGKLTDAPLAKTTDLKIIDLALKNEQLTIPKNTTYFVKLSDKHQKLEVTHQDPLTSKLVIYQSTISKKFALISRLPNKNEQVEPDNRYDERLLTACITFLDSLFIGGKLSVTGGGCEDSLNFVRSHGFIEKITINNAPYDALDADFSKLDIKNITVNNAGNDCVDVSAGYYNFATLTLTGCNDKALSVGERSRVTISNANITKSDIGIASKDSSVVYVKNANIDQNSVAICLNSYRKKQEYEGGVIIVGTTKCDKFQSDKYSLIRTQQKDMCLHITEINGTELCSKQSALEYSYLFKRAKNYHYFLNYYANKNTGDYENYDKKITAAKTSECVDNKPCRFTIKWQKLPDKYQTGERSKLGKISDISVDLSRLHYAQ